IRVSAIRSIELYEAVLDAHSKLGQGIALVDIESGKILYGNEALAAMSGYSIEELLALASFVQIMPPYAAEPMEESRRRRVGGSSEEPDQWETTFLRKDGSRLQVEIAVTPVESDEGMRMVALVRDITERNASLRALRESESRWRTVVASAPVMIWTIDRDGVFTMAEGRVLDRIGMTSADLVGRSIQDVYAQVPALLAHYERALAGEPVEAVVEISGRTLQAQLVPSVEEGELGAVIGVAT